MTNKKHLLQVTSHSAPIIGVCLVRNGLSVEVLRFFVAVLGMLVQVLFVQQNRVGLAHELLVLEQLAHLCILLIEGARDLGDSLDGGSAGLFEVVS